MKHQFRFLLAVATTAAIAAGSAAAQTSGNSAASGADQSKQMQQQMMSGMQQMQQMPMTGDVDKDFATMMRDHHKQGIEMAKMELAHGKSPEMKRMAQQIIKEQQKDNAEFDKWLSKQK
jgi:uncharacterized protein (DUF305 family)